MLRLSSNLHVAFPMVVSSAVTYPPFLILEDLVNLVLVQFIFPPLVVIILMTY